MMGITMPPAAMSHEIKYADHSESLVNMYKPLAKKYQVDFCMFSFRQIQQGSMTVDALIYSWMRENLTRKVVTVPHVNIVRNTSYVVNPRLIRNFEGLRRKDIHFINFPSYRQANKLENCQYLHSFDQFKGHIPPTRPLSLEHLKAFIEQFGSVIIKPVYGSKGRGITTIERDNHQLLVCRTDTNKTPGWSKSISLPQLRLFFNEEFGRPSSFLVQQRIPLEEFHGLPFDMRAVMQKNGTNRWQVTSRVARAARGKGCVTNISQGGEMVPLSKLKRKIKHGDIERLCLKLARAFERIYPWAAEMGIDVAVDKSGKLWYIETNFCPEKTRWSTIFKVPFEYAYYMYTRRVPSKGQ